MPRRALRRAFGRFIGGVRMGAGRRTETVHFNSGAGASTHKVAPQRKLAERGRLGSVIFGCTNATYNECITNKIFGNRSAS